MIKTIIFDFGGVLHNYNHKELIKEVAKEVKKDEELVARAWKYKIVEYEKGIISEEEFWNDFLKIIDKDYDKKVLRQILLDHFYPLENSLKLMRKLKEKYSLGLISNHTTWMDDLEEKYDFKKYFDLIVISNEARSVKPEKKIFEIFIDKIKQKPSEMVFIDDNANYEKSCKELGLNFIHFTSASKLKEDLRKLGVKVN
ncbi:MAG: HAD family hydrolase [Candidatus Woesearchaeota archaeon]